MLSRTVSRLPGAAIATKCERRIIIAYRPAWPPTTTYNAASSTRPSRHASTSSTRWKTRQKSDTHAASAKLAGLKSRAAFKLLEINAKHRLFRPGDTVVDLGFAPGSWSQVAVTKTAPGGRVVGIDVIPATPPRGVSTIQGNFLSWEVREEVRRFVSEPERGRVRGGGAIGMGLTAQELEEEGRGVVERERRLEELETEMENAAVLAMEAERREKEGLTPRQLDATEGRVVNVVLSDMSEPWPLGASAWSKSVSNPWHRMMNTSGMAFRDHAGSMDLALAALTFAYDTVVTNGHFLCKFYQGSEDAALEARLKKLFEKVHRIKPDASRKESREAYLLGLRRRAGVRREDVLHAGD